MPLVYAPLPELDDRWSTCLFTYRYPQPNCAAALPDSPTGNQSATQLFFEAGRVVHKVNNFLKEEILRNLFNPCR
jgi:hypothetical protein